MSGHYKSDAGETRYAALDKSEDGMSLILKDARTVRTAQSLREALLRLLEHKPFDQISIREIAIQAGIHYTTFYRHHSTKEALLNHLAADEVDRLINYTLPVLDADEEAPLVALCEYVEANRALWSILLTGGAAATVRETLLSIATDLANERDLAHGILPVELSTVCTVTTIVESLAWYLRQPLGVFGPEDLAGFLNTLIGANVERGRGGNLGAKKRRGN